MKKTESIQNVDEILKTRPEAFVLTSGASMQPMLRQHRDIAVIKRLNRNPKKSDVLLYHKESKNSLVLHRLIKIKSDGSLVIRGDNNYFTEYEVSKEDIVGVLTEFYREGKYISCKKSRGYRLYSFYILHSYPFRYFFKRKLRPGLGKIYRLLFKNKVK